MASARQALHRWWMALATAVGTILATADASTCQAMGQGRVAPAPRTDDPVQKSRSERSAAKTVPDGPTSPVPIARPLSKSIHRPHWHSQAIPKVVPSYDPNDDTTSDDPDEDDDDPSRFLDDSDDTEMASIARLEDRTPSPIPDECAPAAWTAPPSSSLLRLPRLRC